MTRTFLVAVCLGATLFFFGCDAFSGDDDTSGLVQLTGQVLNADTNNPVEGAFVRVLPYDLLFETDADGNFEADVEIDSTMDLKLTATKEGYGSATTTVLAMAGRTISVPAFRIKQQVDETPTSGKAANIILLEQSSDHIGVKESGAEEVASITFQLADSLGRPVVQTNGAEVMFSFGERPNGGEFLEPTRARTDNNGRVTVNLSSGLKAGVVQIVAEANVDGRMVRSLPVSIAIHGGLPDQEHFSLGPARFNYPILHVLGERMPISVIVGDKYGNPVRPGTAVYFTTNHGVIEGSIQTDELGQGTVTLISAHPMPPDGIIVVTATTADENKNQVSASFPMVWSGIPIIEVSSWTAELNRTYTVKVHDQNGNPLAEGTRLSVQVEGNKVKAVGHTDVEFDDTYFIGGYDWENVVRGSGRTEFTFRAVPDLSGESSGDEDGENGSGNDSEPSVEAIKISVTGPNGKLQVVLTPTGQPLLLTDDASMELLPEGTLQVKLMK
jgi:hypothetical protein